ncbi:cytochrome c biogenesis heme-transporting ATPase CcmA [Ideonella sp.]|uniref:cytochrome c biogenesis heme-transporting ATPase CcmA n=1 Tax=Ideonella sp. TaxID=1929293 RepID=UPI003BB51B45
MNSETPSHTGLQARQLECRRGGRRLFSGLDLDLGAGQALWLRGPNGSGKTSLLRLLAGLAKPEAGQLTHAGAVLPAYIGHGNALKEALTVQQALAFIVSLRQAAPDRERVAQALARFGLQGLQDSPVARLSQGQRRKVALSRLWLESAQVWLLDEPYDALDAAGSRDLNHALEWHLQCGGALVLTSHQAVNLPGLQTLDLGFNAQQAHAQPAPPTQPAHIA